MKIIKIKITNWCLRTYGFHSRMCINCCIGGIKSGIRYSPLSYPAIMVFYIVYQPFYRIVSIRAFICIFRVGMWPHYRSHISKLPLTHPTPSYILINNNISIFHHCFIRANLGFKFICAIRSAGVTGSLHNNRVSIRGRNILGCINCCIQFHTIPHRNIYLLFCVMVFCFPLYGCGIFNNNIHFFFHVIFNLSFLRHRSGFTSE